MSMGGCRLNLRIFKGIGSRVETIMSAFVRHVVGVMVMGSLVFVMGFAGAVMACMVFYRSFLRSSEKLGWRDIGWHLPPGGQTS